MSGKSRSVNPAGVHSGRNTNEVPRPTPSQQEPGHSGKLNDDINKIKESVKEIRNVAALTDTKSIIKELEAINSDFRKLQQAQSTLTEIESILQQKDETDEKRQMKTDVQNLKSRVDKKKYPKTGQSALSETITVERITEIKNKMNSLVDQVKKLEACSRDILKSLQPVLQSSDSKSTKETNDNANKPKPSTRTTTKTTEKKEEKGKKVKEDSQNTDEMIATLKIAVERTKSEYEAARVQNTQQTAEIAEYKKHITDFTEMIKQHRLDLFANAMKSAKTDSSELQVFENLYGDITQEIKIFPDIKKEKDKWNALTIKCEACIVEFTTYVKEEIESNQADDSGQKDQKKNDVKAKPDKKQNVAHLKREEKQKDQNSKSESIKEPYEKIIGEFHEMMKNLKHVMEIKFNQISSLQSQLESVFRATKDVVTTVESIQRSPKPGGFETVDSQIDDTRVKGFNKDMHKIVEIVSGLKQNEEILKKQLQEKLKECDELQIRLSKVAGARLTEGNPSITNLSDPNRPMKIGEKFSELYDNEWTDILDNLIKSKKLTEEHIIQNIYFILQGCYKTCMWKAEKQMEDAKGLDRRAAAAALSLDEKNPELEKILEQYAVDNKQLEELRRQMSDKMVQNMLKDFTKDPEFNKHIKGYKADKDIVEKISKTEFFRKCLGLCWKMVIQDPPMFLHHGVEKGKPYDKNVYREYTSSGSKVVFTVWPALYLHKDGALLNKGVVKVE